MPENDLKQTDQKSRRYNEMRNNLFDIVVMALYVLELYALKDRERKNRLSESVFPVPFILLLQFFGKKDSLVPNALGDYLTSHSSSAMRQQSNQCFWSETNIVGNSRMPVFWLVFTPQIGDFRSQEILIKLQLVIRSHPSKHNSHTQTHSPDLNVGMFWFYLTSYVCQMQMRFLLYQLSPC